MTWMLDLTGPEVEQLGPVPIVLPVGSIEQHGPHLPLDTDSALAESFARVLADRTGGLAIPGISYGARSLPASGGGEIFAGTTSLSAATLCSALVDVLTAFIRRGHQQFVMVNGHFENSAHISEAAHVVQHRHPDTMILALNWWEQTTARELDAIFDGEFPGWESEHAGVVETSLMMHLYPARVRTDLIRQDIATIQPPTYVVVPERHGLVDPSGVLRTARGSSGEIGRRLFEVVMDRSEAICDAEFGHVNPTGTRTAP